MVRPVDSADPDLAQEVLAVQAERVASEVLADREALAGPEEMGEKVGREGSFVCFVNTSLLYCFPQGCLYGGYKRKHLQ